MNLDETKKALDKIKHNPECFVWQDFGDRGNPCTGRLDNLSTSIEIEKNALSLANVKQAMPKYSDLHSSLSKNVACEIGANWVTYDWLSKVLGRILEDDFITFSHMLNLSICVRAKIEEKELVQISSLNELFS